MKRTYYLFLLFALILTGCEKSGEQEIPSEDEPVNILDSMTDAWFSDYCLSSMMPTIMAKCLLKRWPA